MFFGLRCNYKELKRIAGAVQQHQIDVATARDDGEDEESVQALDEDLTADAIKLCEAAKEFAADMSKLGGHASAEMLEALFQTIEVLLPEDHVMTRHQMFFGLRCNYKELKRIAGAVQQHQIDVATARDDGEDEESVQALDVDWTADAIKLVKAAKESVARGAARQQEGRQDVIALLCAASTGGGSWFDTLPTHHALSAFRAECESICGRIRAEITAATTDDLTCAVSSGILEDVSSGVRENKDDDDDLEDRGGEGGAVAEVDDAGESAGGGDIVSAGLRVDVDQFVRKLLANPMGKGAADKLDGDNNCTCTKKCAQLCPCRDAGRACSTDCHPKNKGCTNNGATSLVHIGRPPSNQVSALLQTAYQTQSTASFVCKVKPGVAIQNLEGEGGSIYFGQHRAAVGLFTGTGGNDFVAWSDGGYSPLQNNGQLLFELEPNEVRS
jgi:hypothetical protein